MKPDRDPARSLRTLAAMAVVLSVAAASPAQARSSFGKWADTEFFPTLRGERPLELKPTVSIKHDGAVLRIGPDSAQVRIGGMTVQTHQLQKRLAQAGCIFETGNVMACASDIVFREAQNLAAEERAAAGAISPTASFPRVEPVDGARVAPGNPEVPGGQQGLGLSPDLLRVEPGAFPSSPIFARCRFLDGTALALSSSGAVHRLAPSGMGPPVGFLRPSGNPSVRFFLSDASGLALPVDVQGRVHGPIGPIGQCQ